jgi:hypothetical protein
VNSGPRGSAGLPKRLGKCDIDSVRLRALLLFLAGAIALGPSVFALPGVIDDPDGFTYLRAAASQDGAIVARVKTGEVFDFVFEDQVAHPTEWRKVRLASGKEGYMHFSRIRFHATMADLANRQPGDEANLCARAKGLDYYPLARDAARGEQGAMQRYFGLDCDGAGGDLHSEACRSVIHLLGDEKLSKFLRGQSSDYLVNLREVVEYSAPNAMEPAAYLKRVFPKASHILYAAPP